MFHVKHSAGQTASRLLQTYGGASGREVYSFRDGMFEHDMRRWCDEREREDGAWGSSREHTRIMRGVRDTARFVLDQPAFPRRVSEPVGVQRRLRRLKKETFYPVRLPCQSRLRLRSMLLDPCASARME